MEYSDRFKDEELINIPFVKTSGDTIKNNKRFGALLLLDESGNCPEDILCYSKCKNETLESFLNNIKRYITIRNDISPGIISVDYSDTDIHISLENEDEVPVLIKFSYSPFWESEGDETIFLSNPSIMLIFAKGDISVSLTPFYLGYAISAISVAVLLFFMFMQKFKKWYHF